MRSSQMISGSLLGEPFFIPPHPLPEALIVFMYTIIPKFKYPNIHFFALFCHFSLVVS